jgi:hyperosmotically inducible protein
MFRMLGSTAIFVFALQTSVFAQAPDNTNVNRRDRNSGTTTADQQNGNRSDLEITREIRHSITQDKGLSTYARNVKVITKGGNVTLRGPVRSEEEKKSIGSKADSIAGAGHVKNELEVAAKPAK